MATSNSDAIWNMMDENNFQMIDEVSSDMMCTICNKVMMNASIGLCGCRYCIGCIRNYLNEGNINCPGGLKFCNVEMINVDDNIHTDHSANYRIMRTIVKCPLGSCQHRDELQNMVNHLRTCKSRPVNCPYFTIGCDQDKLGGDKMRDHLEIENYGHTKLLIEYVDNLRNEMELLKTEMAELRQDNNRHKLDGERRQVVIGELQANVKVNCEQVDLLNEEMSALKNDNRSMQQQINNLTQADRQNQLAMGELQAKLDGQSQQIDQWKEKSEQSDKSIKTIEDKTENLDLKMYLIRKNLEKQNEFVWVIKNISGKLKQAKDNITTKIFSDDFYSHKNGYKMCLRVNPNGYGDGKGSHLSVCFCLLPGPFDDILSWPFNSDVTFYLVNQQTGFEHMTMTSKYDKFPNSPAYKKPTNERNKGRGKPQFIKLDQLLSNAALIKDDKIIIKCTVSIL